MYTVTGELAHDSPDHLNPFGVKLNNSHNQAFNDKLYQLFPYKIKLLDIGCAGGASVKSFIDQGHEAIGLEGSDYRKSRRMPEWETIPDNLFICDVTRPFEILRNGEPVKFDVITAWEFLEHISTTDLPKFYKEIKKYLAPGGGWIVSICVFDEERSRKTYGIEWGEKEKFSNVNCGHGLGLHHQNCVPTEWWIKNLEENGFKLNWDKLNHFKESNAFVRGPGIEASEDCTINLYIEVV